MLISEAPIGTKIAFGQDGDDDIIWRKITNNNDFIAETAVGHLCFDYYEHNSPSREKRNHGNNFYPQSNIAQWLNSDCENWFVNQHKYDIDPYYAILPGFQTRFTQVERDAMLDREITVAVPLGSRKEHGKAVQITAKVTLPSASEVGYNKEELLVEGEAIPEINRILTVHPFTRMLTRTGTKSGGHIFACYGKSVDAIPAACNFDIRPIIRLNGEVVLTDAEDNYGLRYLVCQDEGFMEAFLNIIKS